MVKVKVGAFWSSVFPLVSEALVGSQTAYPLVPACRFSPKLGHHTCHPIYLLLCKPLGLLARLVPIRLGSGFYLLRFWVCSD